MASKLAAMIGFLICTLALAACGGSDSNGGTSIEGNQELFTTAGFQEAHV
jgi:hypothetical protein